MEWVKLGDVVDFQNGYAFKSSQFKTYGTPVIRISDLNDTTINITKDKTVRVTEDVPVEYLIEKGDLLLGLSGSVGKIGLYSSSEKAYLNQRVAKVIPKKHTYPPYVRYLIKSLIEMIEKDSVGGTVLNISSNTLKNYKLNIHDINNQKIIADDLQKTESLISTRKAQIAALEELVQSLFYEMFGDVYEKRFKVVRIKDIYTSTQYGSSSKASAKVNEYPILRMGNITYNGKLDLSDLKYIDLAEDERDKYLVQKNDLLFNRTNSVELVGKTALYDLEKPMAYAGYLIRLRINEKHILPKFLAVQMNSPYLKKVLRHMAKGIIGQANINAKEMLEIEIILPPLELQEQFAAKVEAIETQKAKLQTSLEEMETLFDALMQEAFSGNLG